jgi:hypothetical protein
MKYKNMKRLTTKTPRHQVAPRISWWPFVPWSPGGKVAFLMMRAIEMKRIRHQGAKAPSFSKHFLVNLCAFVSWWLNFNAPFFQ